MAWLDLVVPSAAILALFAVVALVVVAVIQGRRLRRIEERLADVGESAVEAPLRRIAELQERHAVSSGVTPTAGSMRTAGLVALVAVALVAGIGGVWYLFVRGDAGAGSSAGTPAATTAGTTGTTPVEPPTPVDTTLVPEEVPVLPDKSIYTLTVFNATGIAGAAGDVVAPALRGEGWTVPDDAVHVQNEPDGVTGLKDSVVMWTKGKRRVAWSVAKDLGIARAPRVDGYTDKEIGNADVVVLVGLDLATGGVTPTP